MFVKVTSEAQISQVEHLAQRIWTGHYTDIIGIEQVDYMLARYQSFDAISQQLSNGDLVYYLIEFENENVGYLAFRFEDDGIFLSKIYIESAVRGLGFARKTLDFLKQKLSEVNGKSIRLTVNKDNRNSISAYQRMGFRITDEICVDIGSGFVMDDYEMCLFLPEP